MMDRRPDGETTTLPAVTMDLEEQSEILVLVCGLGMLGVSLLLGLAMLV